MWIVQPGITLYCTILKKTKCPKEMLSQTSYHHTATPTISAPMPPAIRAAAAWASADKLAAAFVELMVCVDAAVLGVLVVLVPVVVVVVPVLVVELVVLVEVVAVLVEVVVLVVELRELVVVVGKTELGNVRMELETETEDVAKPVVEADAAIVEDTMRGYPFAFRARAFKEIDLPGALAQALV